MGSDPSNRAKKAVVKKHSKVFKRKNNNHECNKTKTDNFKKEFRNKRKINRKARAVIYLGHIPHGFYEFEMESYFNQFGKVLGVTIARSKKTGRSKGYGFVQFADEEVAKIAAEAMNNYLMFNKIIKCRYIPPEERKGKLFFQTTNVRDYPRKANRRINAKNKAKALSQLNQQTYLKKTEEKINEFKKFFEERGINFTFKIKGEKDDYDRNCKDVDSDDGQLNTASSLHDESKAEDDSDGQFDVLEIDESDDEIDFKTPPLVKKIIKRFVGSPGLLNKPNSCKDSPTGNKIKRNSLDDSSIQKTKLGKNKNNFTATSCLPNIKEKTKIKRKVSAKVKTKNIAPVIKMKDSKSLKDTALVRSKSRKNLKHASQGDDGLKTLKKVKIS